MFASDPEGVAAAESLAREYNVSLRVWGVSEVPSVTWRVGGPPLAGGDPLPWGLRQFLAQSARQDPRLREEARRVRHLVQGEEFAMPGPYREAAEQAEEATIFEALLLQNARVEGPPNMDEYDRKHVYPPSVLGKRLAELPNPYEPLLRIWSLGYLLGSTLPEGILLHAPRLGGSSP